MGDSKAVKVDHYRDIDLFGHTEGLQNGVEHLLIGGAVILNPAGIALSK